jgi:hypothetical protein
VALVGTKWAVLGGKSGPVYVLRQGHLGGIGGQVSVTSVCLSFGGAAVSGNVVYLPCTDGVGAVRVDGAGKLHVLWHAASSVAGSPVIGGGAIARPASRSPSAPPTASPPRPSTAAWSSSPPSPASSSSVPEDLPADRKRNHRGPRRV